MKRARRPLSLACLSLLLLLPSLAFAHAGSKSWLTLTVDESQLSGRLVTSQVDAAIALELDVRQSPAALSEQIASRHDELLAYAHAGLALLLNGDRSAVEFSRVSTAIRNAEPVLVFELQARAPARITSLDIAYTLFFEDDVLHECLARIEWGASSREGVFRLGEPLLHLDRADGAGAGFLQFVRLGIWHIWTGYDHVLFLLALLLPAVLVRTGRTWVPAARLPGALARAASIVTAFTIAHSLTLACAALELVHLPERGVESAIALSVLIAAASNLFPSAMLSGPGMALVFGLLHGFGFAGVLAELVPDARDVWRPLVAFNLGVECGQLAILAVFLPMAWQLRTTRFYRDVVLRAGSVLICGCSVIWFVARAIG